MFLKNEILVVDGIENVDVKKMEMEMGLLVKMGLKKI